MHVSLLKITQNFWSHRADASLPGIAGGAGSNKQDEANSDGDYATHPWNINNLPRNRGSTLRYLAGNELITGVQVPCSRVPVKFLAVTAAPAVTVPWGLAPVHLALYQNACVHCGNVCTAVGTRSISVVCARRCRGCMWAACCRLSAGT